ncbi:MAG: LCP family protein [Acidimicrobiales bacterium]
MLIAANIFVAVTLVAVGGAYAYVRYRIDSIHTVAAPDLTAQGNQTGTNKPVTGTAGGTAENILLIGNQSRAGLTTPADIQQFGNPQLLSGSLSDVIMILHLDPKTKQASILSIPRDLFSHMPAGSPVLSWEKIDAALNDGVNGPDNLVKAIQEDFGIPINHYVEINFDGFENTVNALGGLRMYFPEKLYDLESQLNITTTGCLQINGAQALALVRSRHLQYDPPGYNGPVSTWPYDPESDLARIVRDHEFVRVLLSTAVSKGLTNPITLNSFIGAVINQVTMDPGLKNQLISLAETYGHLNPNSIPETTLPVTTYNGYYYRGASMGDIDFPVQPNDYQTIAKWDPSALPAPVAPTTVTVLNIVGSYNLASTTATALQADGFNIGTIANGAVPANPSETVIEYPTGGLAQAVSVLDKLSGAVALKPDPSLPAGTVTVEAGTNFSVVGASTPNPTTSATSTASTSASASSTGVSPSTTNPPTVGNQTPSSSADNLTPYDPRPCPSGAPVKTLGG